MYLAAEAQEAGQPASVLLPPLLQALVHALSFKKGMRWGDVEQSFARPVQWILALHGTEVVPVVFGDVRSGRLSYGHRFLAPQPISIGHPREYPRRWSGRTTSPTWPTARSGSAPGWRAWRTGPGSGCSPTRRCSTR
jgi:glycyl-tRNA synthetase beta chain